MHDILGFLEVPLARLDKGHPVLDIAVGLVQTRIWLRNFSETANPEASSAALLMRWPELSFWMLLLTSF
jgi:hypothetical protein